MVLEADARVINAQPWEPPSGMVKRVYVIEEQPHSDEVIPPRVKVGRCGLSAEVTRGQLQRGNPRPLVVKFETELLTLPEAIGLERTAHLWLHDHSLGGEWFACAANYAEVAIKSALNARRNPRTDAEEVELMWRHRQSRSNLPNSPVHLSVAAHRARAKRAKQRGDLPTAAYHEDQVASLLRQKARAG
jgi:hypothetical protein